MKLLKSCCLVLLAVGCGHAGQLVSFSRGPLGAPVRGATPDASFRATAPVATVRPSFVPPPVQEARLTNGIRVLYLERHDFPLVVFRLVSRFGADAAPPAVASLWSGLLFEGPEGKDRGKFYQAFNAHGVSTRALAYNDYTAIRLEMLSSDVRRPLEILSEALQAPAFPKGALDDDRDYWISTLARRNDDPETVGELAAYAALYPAGDRYHDDPAGTPAAIRAVRREELVEYHANAIDAGRLTIAVAGDFKPEVLLADLQKSFGSIADRKVSAPAKLAAPGKSKSPKVTFIDRPGASQAYVVVGALGATADHPDHAALSVLRERLAWVVHFKLREKKAITYGASVHSYFGMRPWPVMITGAIESAHAGEAVRDILAELDRLKETELTAKQAGSTSDDAVLGIAYRLNTVEGVSTSLANLGGLGLPTSRFSELAKLIGAVTAADIQRVAKAYFAAEDIRIVVVGDKKDVKSQLDGLGEVDVQEGAAEPSGGGRSDD